MIKAILKGIMSLVSSIVGLILTPINALINGIFPDMSVYISNFNNFIHSNIFTPLSWVASFIPTGVKTLLLLWLSFLITYYTIIWTYTGIIKIYNVIRKVKFW